MGTMCSNFNAMPPAFKTVAVIGRYNTAEIAESLLGLADLLQQRGCNVLIEKETAANIGRNGFAAGDYPAIGAEADLAVVLGGDGSLLPGARHPGAHRGALGRASPGRPRGASGRCQPGAAGFHDRHRVLAHAGSH